MRRLEGGRHRGAARAARREAQPRGGRAHGERLKVALQAPPVDGKANQALVKFLAGVAGVPKSAVELIAGETSREKRLEIRGVERAGLLAALAEAQNA